MPRGSALIDTLVAVAVMAMGVLGFSSASLHMNALGKAGLARDVACATLQRQAQLLRAAAFESLTSRDGQEFDQPSDLDHDGITDTSMIRVAETQPSLLAIDLSLEWGSSAARHRAHQRIFITNRRSLGE